MGLLHPTEEDHAFSCGHAEIGWNKAIHRCMRLRRLLEAARRSVTDPSLASNIDAALKQSFYDEPGSFPPSGWEKSS